MLVVGVACTVCEERDGQSPAAKRVLREWIRWAVIGSGGGRPRIPKSTTSSWAFFVVDGKKNSQIKSSLGSFFWVVLASRLWTKSMTKCLLFV